MTYTPDPQVRAHTNGCDATRTLERAHESLRDVLKLLDEAQAALAGSDAAAWLPTLTYQAQMVREASYAVGRLQHTLAFDHR